MDKSLKGKKIEFVLDILQQESYSAGRTFSRGDNFLKLSYKTQHELNRIVTLCMLRASAEQLSGGFT